MREQMGGEFEKKRLEYLEEQLNANFVGSSRVEQWSPSIWNYPEMNYLSSQDISDTFFQIPLPFVLA